MDQDVCPTHGGPKSECGDVDKDWFPQRDICRPSMELAATRRLYDLLHEDKPYHDGTETKWAKEPSWDFPYHYLDGVTIRVSEIDENPDDDFLSADKRPSVVESDDGDEM